MIEIEGLRLAFPRRLLHRALVDHLAALVAELDGEGDLPLVGGWILDDEWLRSSVLVSDGVVRRPGSPDAVRPRSLNSTLCTLTGPTLALSAIDLPVANETDALGAQRRILPPAGAAATPQSGN